MTGLFYTLSAGFGQGAITGGGGGKRRAHNNLLRLSAARLESGVQANREGLPAATSSRRRGIGLSIHIIGPLYAFTQHMTLMPPQDSATCRRCGTCCEQGGPALHREDRELVAAGALRLRDLIAIRAGEPVYDQRRGRVEPAAAEFLKLAGARGGWSCTFYEPARGCGIYGQRPLECRLLFCRDTGPLEAVMGRDLLGRRDLLVYDDPVLEWLLRLERAVDFAEVGALLAGLRQPGEGAEALARLTGLVRADLALREAFLRSFPEREAEELFLLGRPLFLVIAPYGCRLVQGPGGVGLQYPGLGG